MTNPSDYVPPKVWTWNKGSGGSPVTSRQPPDRRSHA
jgi:GST-like protein